MKTAKSTILYLFVILIIVIGLLLFIFKDSIVSRFLNYNNNEITPAKPSSAGLNLDILRDSRIKELKNYISVFDYNDLDKSQDAVAAVMKAQEDVIISNPEEVGTSTEAIKVVKPTFVRVRVGNSNPFIVNKVVK